MVEQQVNNNVVEKLTQELCLDADVVKYLTQWWEAWTTWLQSTADGERLPKGQKPEVEIRQIRQKLRKKKDVLGHYTEEHPVIKFMLREINDSMQLVTRHLEHEIEHTGPSHDTKLGSVKKLSMN